MSNKNTIFLLHGWRGSINSLNDLSIELKKKGVHIVMCEMPGHGSTPEMNTPWGMNEFSNWILNILKKHNTINPILVGHSFGGKIILELLKQKKYPSDKAIIINASGIKPKNSLKRTIASKIAKLLKPVFKIPLLSPLRYYMYRIFLGETDYVKTSSNMRESFKKFNNEYYTNESFQGNLVETLIIWGKQDSTTPIWMGERLHKYIPNSKIQKLNGSHGLPIKEPKPIANLIYSFITS